MSDEKLKAAIYCRTSTDGDNSKYSIDYQEQVLRKRIASEENIEVYDVYKDYGFTGAKEDRPDFIRLKNDIKAHKIDIVYCFKLSRIARKARLIQEFIMLLDDNNVKLTVTEDGIDGRAGFSNKILLPILAAFVEMEYENIKLFTLKNRLERMKKGHSAGGPVPYGYKRIFITDEDGNEETGFDVIDEEAKVVKEIFERVANKVPLKQIQDDLENRNIATKDGNKITTNFIKRMITRHTYRGFVQFNNPNRNKNVKNKDEEILVEGKHKAIVSDELFFRANQVIQDLQRKREIVHKDEEDINFLFSGQLLCRKCHAKLRNKKNGKYTYYLCDNAKKNNSCTEGLIKAKLIEQALVIQITEDILKNKTFIKNVNQLIEILKDREDLLSNTNLISKNEVKINDINKRIERLQNDYYQKRSLSDDKYTQIQNDLISKKDKLVKEIEELQHDEQKGIIEIPLDTHMTSFVIWNYTLSDVEEELKDPEKRRFWYDLVKNYIDWAVYEIDDEKTKIGHLEYAAKPLLQLLMTEDADIELGEIPSNIKFTIY